MQSHVADLEAEIHGLHQQMLVKLSLENLADHEKISTGYFEKQQSLAELDRLLLVLKTEPRDEKKYRSIRDFLKNRWERIKGTCLAYPYVANDPFTVLCVKLAEIITPFYGVELDGNYYRLLMPTLTPQNNDLFGNDVKDLKLQQFVLSNDDQFPLSIIDILDSAQNDGKFYHPFIINEKGVAVRLSEEEMNRVTHHTRQSYQYAEAIGDKMRYEMQSTGESRDLLTELKKLISALRSGDYKHGGKLLDSGEAANVGIVNFSEYIESLSPKDRNQLMQLKLSNDYLSPTFSTCWNNMARIFEKSNYKNRVHCVYLIANDIEIIIKHNKEKLEKSAIYKNFYSMQAQAKTAYENPDKHKLKIHSQYMEEFNLAKIIETIFKNASKKDLENLITQFTPTGEIGLQIVCKYIHDQEILAHIFNSISKESLLAGLLFSSRDGNTGFEYLVKYVKNPNILTQVMVLIEEYHLLQDILLKQNRFGFSNFHAAAAYLTEDTLIQKILDVVADISIKDRHECTPIMYAIDEGNVSFVKASCKMDIDINQTDKAGKGLLERAVDANQQDILKVLINQYLLPKNLAVFNKQYPKLYKELTSRTSTTLGTFFKSAKAKIHSKDKNQDEGLYKPFLGKPRTLRKP